MSTQTYIGMGVDMKMRVLATKMANGYLQVTASSHLLAGTQLAISPINPTCDYTDSNLTTYLDQS